jgi:ABC-2 type transport system ATP-binding protein
MLGTALPPRTSSEVARIVDAVLLLGGRRALNGATLSLRRGEILALLGPNGAGKTSLLRVLYGGLPLTRGTVAVGEPLQDPRSRPEARRLIGLVPQNIALYPRLTVRENLEVFAQPAKKPRRREAIDRVLRNTRLAAVADAIIATLSGGLQRRVNIAVALVSEPRLLLLDEPTVGIDLEARSAIHDVLTDLRDQGVAVLMVTHDFDQAERLADRIGIMIDGRIVLEGPPKDVLRQAYGDKREVQAILENPPDRAAVSELQGLGLSPVDGRRLWTGLTAEPAISATELLEKLQSSRIPLSEVRIRTPGLETLFRQVTRDRSR